MRGARAAEKSQGKARVQSERLPGRHEICVRGMVGVVGKFRPPQFAADARRQHHPRCCLPAAVAARGCEGGRRAGGKSFNTPAAAPLWIFAQPRSTGPHASQPIHSPMRFRKGLRPRSSLPALFFYTHGSIDPEICDGGCRGRPPTLTAPNFRRPAPSRGHPNRTATPLGRWVRLAIAEKGMG